MNLAVFSSRFMNLAIVWVSKAIISESTSPTRLFTTSIKAQKKSKSSYISHETAIRLIKHERDPQHALEIFNMVSEQKGFNHNNATYASILQKLAKSKKFQAIDGVLHQMTYDTCKLHEVDRSSEAFS